jgi:mycofactocin glycosyltransferase
MALHDYHRRPSPLSTLGLATSIVICTKDRPDDLARAIASVRASGTFGQGAEIVVVEETDSPCPVPGTNYVPIPRQGRGFGYARNVGVRAARGEILLFTDDDCEVAGGWAEGLAAPLRNNPRILGVAGAVLVRNCGLIGYAENILGFPGGGLRYRHAAKGGVVPTRHLSTCNCAYRKEAILQAGGFVAGARLGGEDFLLAERIVALGPCVYAPDAVVFHRPRGRLPDIFRWFMRRGESEIALLQTSANRGGFLRFLLRSSWSLRAVGLLTLCLVWPPLLALLPIAVAAYYGAMLWRFRFARAYPSHRRAWWLVPVIKLVMDIGTEAGRWRALLHPGLR